MGSGLQTLFLSLPRVALGSGLEVLLLVAPGQPGLQLHSSPPGSCTELRSFFAPAGSTKLRAGAPSRSTAALSPSSPQPGHFRCRPAHPRSVRLPPPFPAPSRPTRSPAVPPALPGGAHPGAAPLPPRFAAAARRTARRTNETRDTCARRPMAFGGRGRGGVTGGAASGLLCAAEPFASRCTAAPNRSEVRTGRAGPGRGGARGAPGAPGRGGTRRNGGGGDRGGEA